MNLLTYVLRRAAAVLPILVLLPFLTLLLMHWMPGNYFDTLRLNPQISPETIRQYEAMYHLDAPLPVQYFHWLLNLFRLDLGYSFAYRQPVTQILGSRLWNTFLLSGVSFLGAWLLAVLAGLAAGLKPGGWFDRAMSAFSYAALSIPAFFLCILFLYAASRTDILPLGGMRSVHHEALPLGGRLADVAVHLLIPASVLGLGTFAYLFRIMRSQTVDVASREFVLYLRSLGIPRRMIVFRHIARNALNPLVTIFGLELPALFSGAALVEIFTGWPGLGQVMLQAVRTQDVFLVLGNMVMISFLLIAGNLAADLLLVAVDPRIRLEGSRG
ncbi:MAG: ABC transporter permease [Candidatus Omnitrophica bacterium]|nr:ABC transporter permease [Candidatus Omnitrophota bacterium]